MEWLLTHLEKEMSLIEGAPLSFLFAWFLGSALIWWVLDKYVYRERLALKDDLIRTYQIKLGLSPVEPSSKEELNQKINLLTQYIEQGQELIRRCRTQQELVPPADAQAWATQVEQSIEQILDASYISRFRSSVGMPMRAAYWPNLDNRQVDGFCYVRVYRLQEFVDELRAR
ncbi:MAG: hypothetical protein ABSF45_15150 [Terriglobia bacterium]|jgi:hypothetical protein